MVERLAVDLLGTFRIRDGEHVVTRFRTHKTAALLAYLAFYADRSHAREVLIEMLWPEAEAGQQSLRTALTSLRHQLEPPGVAEGTVLHTNRSTVQLNPEAITTDVGDFERLLKQANTGTKSEEARCSLLEEGLTLYRGLLLPGFYETWVLPQALRLEELYFHAVRDCLLLLERHGTPERAIVLASRAIGFDPLREDLRFDLMRLYAASHRPDLALQQFDELERLLKQTGETPSTLLCESVARLRRGGMPKSPSNPSVPASSAGATRDADLSPGYESAPALAPRHPGFIPRLTRFFGRETELAQLEEALLPNARPPLSGPRLYTLTGPGGSGKTRLAWEAAMRLQETFPHAVWFTSLADCKDAHLIPEAIQEAMRLPRIAGLDPFEQVVTRLSSGPALLILDNFEQLVEEGAEVVGRLLERLPLLTCLVTSRQCLDWEGEREFPVAPLPVPAPAPPEQMIAFASVQLYVDRAQAVRPDFQLTRANARAVVELCRRLEGLPLALELAAARIGVLTPAQMLAQISDRFALLVSSKRNLPSRHRSLKAALDWSYDLLPPPLKPLFTSLSAFRGGWTAEAAEVVCGVPEALDGLEQLRHRSLILVEERGEETRFRMLETIREYAMAQLEPKESARLVQRHANYYLALAEQAARSWMGRGEKEWMDRLESEHDNLRVALDWYQRSAESAATGLRMASALWRFWLTRAYLAEGRARLEMLLAQMDPQVITPERTRALIQCGVLIYAQGDYVEAQAYLETALELSRNQGEEADIAFALNSLGLVVFNQGQITTARTLFEEAIDIRRRLDDKAGIAASLSNLGYVFLREESRPHAQACFEESLALRQELGDEAGRADSLLGLGLMIWNWKPLDPLRVKPYLREGMALLVRMENYRVVVRLLDTFGKLAAEQGEVVRATRLAGAASAQRIAMGLSESQKERLTRDHYCSPIRQQLGEEAFQAAYKAGQALTMEEAVAEALQV